MKSETESTPLRRKAPSKRRRTAAPAFPEAQGLRGRLTSEAEKRELILAHAAMRKTHDPVQRMSVWAGVAVTSFIIFFSWGWAFFPNAIKAFKQPAEESGGLLKSLPALTDTTEAKAMLEQSGLSQVVKQTQASLEQLTEQARANQTVLDAMAATLNTTTTANSTTTIERTESPFSPSL